MGRYRLFTYRSAVSNWVGAVLAALLIAGCAAQTTTAPPPPLAAGMARVWFLRQADPPGGELFAADPTVFVDRTSLAQIKQGTSFFHDFSPGRYRLSVQAFGTPIGQHDTVQLAPGTETYVQIIATANWELGSPAGGWSFAVLPMSPGLAKQYLLDLADLGQH
jgi:hypothetical protein